MNGSEKFGPVFAAPKDQGRDKLEDQTKREIGTPADFNSEDIKNWEEENGEICIKKIEAIPTPLWHDGWYRNPTSGRSNNYGINTENPGEHSTVVVKGGCFFVDEKCKEFFKNNSVSLEELYGGISFDAAKREYDIATLIQGRFKELLGKKANCPEPIDVKVITNILTERHAVVALADFFLSEIEKEEGKVNFITTNFVHYATKLGIDVFYPTREGVEQSIKDDAFGWLFRQCLEKEKQGVYRYKIEGPNTRLLDLMTLDLPDRRKYFMEANNATNIRGAVEKFSAKLGEFYGVLHKSNISYHAGRSEHCTLVDTTISGVIMDIGGLSQNNSVDPRNEAYAAQLIKTTNLLTYLCANILKLNETISRHTLRSFLKKYKSFYADRNLEYSFKRTNAHEPDNIRTHYFDVLASDWVTLAPDLKGLDTL